MSGRFGQNSFGFGVTVEHGQRLLAQLRGEAPTEHDEEARAEQQAVLARLEPEAPAPEPEPRTPAPEPAHALTALPDLVADAMGRATATAALALVATVTTEEVGHAELSDAWRDTERCIGLALALACHHYRAEVSRRARGEAPTARERKLTSARMFLIGLRHSLRRLVCDACETRRWPEPIGIDRLPRLT